MITDPAEFEAFENEQTLFDLRIDGVPVWERIRFDVYREINHQKGEGQAHSRVGESYRDYLRGFGLFLKNIIRKNPFLAGETDVAFFGHPRRKQGPDGYWWDLYCDPIHIACDVKSVHIESPYQLRHCTPARTKNIRYRELISYGGEIQQLLGLNEPSLTDAARGTLESAECAIDHRFSVDINLVERVLEELHERRSELWLYRRLLDRLNPELVVIVVSYSDETLIEACKERDIPVAELQHGVIHRAHFGYSYRGERTKEMFPDYLLTFGDFWNDKVELPLPDDRVISVGYPFLEKSIAQYDNVESTKQLLFISQGTVGERLSRFAMEVSQHPEMEYDIVYKLHPGEYDRWEENYPWLIEADFELVDSSDRQLYKMFAESSAQIGVGSTAVYEGLAFGLETYIYDCLGSDMLQPLVDEGSAELISSADELVSSLGEGGGLFDREYYFTPNASERACEIIERLR